MPNNKRNSRRIYLEYHGITIYFGPREVQCMALILEGKATKAIAEYLDLSPRTVEFYLFNIRNKLAARTKKELIQRVLETDFLDKIKHNDSYRNTLSDHTRHPHESSGF